MRVEQFVLAYRIEQDRIRAMLPEGFESLRPVLRINAEIRDEKDVYLEFNTPVSHDRKRGWLNIAHWDGDLTFHREGNITTVTSPFFRLIYTTVGIEGGCPAENDNEGTFFTDDNPPFRHAEIITAKKQFCDCEFAWLFHDDNAHGKSIGKTLPAFCEEQSKHYDHIALTVENAAAIPCRQVLGCYVVRFER
jgi:hypothetical protein